MTLVKTKIGRRAFIRNTGLASGGLVIGFSWLASCKMTPEQVNNLPKEWFDLNGFLKVGDNGLVTIMSPNPEIGQNVKTSMPMIVAVMCVPVAHLCPSIEGRIAPVPGCPI